MSLIDLVWPHAGKESEDTYLEGDISQIDTATWGDETIVFLDEARRLRDVENSRKTTAETKSQIFLAALFALIPILITLTEHSAFKGTMVFSFWYQTVGFILFCVGIIYGIGAFTSSFRALQVSAHHRVDFGEIVSSGRKKSPSEHITKEILKSVRRDRSNINHKISYVIVTQKLAFRMALFFLAALTLITIVPHFDTMIAALKSRVC